MKRKRSEEYKVFSYDFGGKKKALSDMLALRFIFKYSKHREAGLNLQGFWSLWAYAYLTLDFQRHFTLKTYLSEWKLLSLNMFHRVICILLIVSSLFLNLIAAQVVFSQTYNKTSHASVLKMRRVDIKRFFLDVLTPASRIHNHNCQ